MVDWRRRVERGWYEGSGWLTPLRPLGWLVGRVAGRRLRRFRRRAERPPVPVLVVGNVAVGGTGKTPLVIALARRCWTLSETAPCGGRSRSSSRTW